MKQVQGPKIKLYWTHELKPKSHKEAVNKAMYVKVRCEKPLASDMGACDHGRAGGTRGPPVVSEKREDQMEITKPKPVPVAPEVNRATRKEMSLAFLKEWVVGEPDEKTREMFSCLARSIEKGYFVLNNEGMLVMTDKGAWREITRQKQGR